MDKNDIFYTSTTIASLTVVIDSLAFIDKSLTKFIANKKKENFFRASELAGLSYCLHNVRERAQDCYNDMPNKQQFEKEDPTVLNEEAKSSSPPNPNPLIRNTILDTLNQIIDTLQFMVSMLDQFKRKGKKKLLMRAEVSGLRNMIKGIKGAAEHCLTLCPVS